MECCGKLRERLVHFQVHLSKYCCSYVTLGDDKLKKLFAFGVQWVVKGACEVDIGANPSAEGGEDEGVDDSAVKVVDIVDVFRLQVRTAKHLFISVEDSFLI